jgi:hypothetical protein
MGSRHSPPSGSLGGAFILCARRLPSAKSSVTFNRGARRLRPPNRLFALTHGQTSQSLQAAGRRDPRHEPDVLRCPLRGLWWGLTRPAMPDPVCVAGCCRSGATVTDESLAAAPQLARSRLPRPQAARYRGDIRRGGSVKRVAQRTPLAAGARAPNTRGWAGTSASAAGRSRVMEQRAHEPTIS